MQIEAESHDGAFGPKAHEKHISHDENVNEPARLIDEEAVEVERETPAEDSESVERSSDGKPPIPPAFED